MSLERPKDPMEVQLTERREELDQLLSEPQDENREMRVEELLAELNSTDYSHQYTLFACGLTGAREVFSQPKNPRTTSETFLTV